ncbi:RusA family crossover junction endodeoxyribonuclease [Stenotrophomonas maltophilia]|uniref:RusA family crossover junction endodeoxyribonuclease n=1 Tax=Stenotrophomonas maltophilia TaxID=40324 RepID=UPI0013DD0556|nr:RusA family crossover junction endodeoxyribonuclease [Stenotrophomonas maltophilia]
MHLGLKFDPMPAPRPRARAFVVKGKAIVSMYHPKEYTAYQADLADAIKDAIGDVPPMEGPLHVAIVVFVERPKTTKLDAPKPDADNYAKGILDAATKAGIWVDDTQVVHLEVVKLWASPGDESAIGIAASPADIAALMAQFEEAV